MITKLNSDKKVSVSVDLPAGLIGQLDQHCQETGADLSGLVCQILQDEFAGPVQSAC